MPTIYDLAQEHRKRLLAADADTARTLIAAYQKVDADLQARLKALTELIEIRRMNGEEVSLAWLQREERYITLMAQTEAEIKRLARLTEAVTQSAVLDAQLSGARDAETLIRAGIEEAGITGSFDRLNTRAVETIVSSFKSSSPLAGLLDKIKDEMPQAAIQKAKDVLTIGVATGQGPRVIATNFRAVTGESLTRSLTIARTETLRVYRNASLIKYQESEAVEGWEWMATKSLRSCAACLANDGKVFSKDTPFASHVRCRCTPIPVIAGGARKRTPASEWFAGLDEEDQIRVLGKEGTDLYRNGRVTLDDYVRTTHSPTWGDSYVKGSDKYALQQASRREPLP
jgi:SPP1 gp7 family putative phage head morphogenesis protein